MDKRLLPVFLLPLLAAGCAWVDPYQRPGTWRPAGVNARNLAAMVVQPAELQRGTGEERPTGIGAANPVDRLRSDRVRTLPDSGLARIVTVPNSALGGQ